MIRPPRSFQFASAAVVAGSAIHVVILLGPVVVFGGIAAVRFGIAPILLCGLIAGWSIAETFCSRSRDATAPDLSRRTGPNCVLGLSLLLVHWVCVWDSFRTAAPAAIVLTAGSALMIGGMWLRLSAIRRLGGRFLDDVVLLPGHAYESGGVYNWLRHPSEAGTLLLAVGGALIAGSLAATLLTLTCLLPCVLIRIRREDELLAERFGELFREHAQRVPSVLPRLRFRSKSA